MRPKDETVDIHEVQKRLQAFLEIDPVKVRDFMDHFGEDMLLDDVNRALRLAQRLTGEIPYQVNVSFTADIPCCENSDDLDEASAEILDFYRKTIIDALNDNLDYSYHDLRVSGGFSTSDL